MKTWWDAVKQNMTSSGASQRYMSVYLKTRRQENQLPQLNWKMTTKLVFMYMSACQWQSTTTSQVLLLTTSLHLSQTKLTLKSCIQTGKSWNNADADRLLLNNCTLVCSHLLCTTSHRHARTVATSTMTTGTWRCAAHARTTQPVLLELLAAHATHSYLLAHACQDCAAAWPWSMRGVPFTSVKQAYKTLRLFRLFRLSWHSFCQQDLSKSSALIFMEFAEIKGMPSYIFKRDWRAGHVRNWLILLDSQVNWAE